MTRRTYFQKPQKTRLIPQQKTRLTPQQKTRLIPQQKTRLTPQQKTRLTPQQQIQILQNILNNLYYLQKNNVSIVGAKTFITTLKNRIIGLGGTPNEPPYRNYNPRRFNPPNAQAAGATPRGRATLGAGATPRGRATLGAGATPRGRATLGEGRRVTAAQQKQGPA